MYVMRKTKTSDYAMKTALDGHIIKSNRHNGIIFITIDSFLPPFIRNFELIFIFYFVFNLCSFGYTGLPGIELNGIITDHNSHSVSQFVTLVGSSILLPCNITPPSSEDISALIIWYKDDVRNPIYTVDGRTGQFKSNHFAGKLIRDRVKFNVKAPISFLRLDPVIEQDEGYYKCRVDFKRGRTINHIMYLNVIVPCKQIIIYDQDRNVIDKIGGPYNEGSSVNLTCESDKGNPSASVTWWQGALLIDDNYRITERKTVVNTLQLDTIDRKDLMKEFTCKASNNNLTQALIQTIYIDLNLKPKEIYIIDKVESYFIGQMYHVTCKSIGSRPAAKIFWHKDGQRLNSISDTVLEDGLLTISKIELVPSLEDNGKQIVCNAVNQEFSDFFIEDRYNLNVNYAPILSLALGANTQHEDIRKGSDVTFECNIQGNPQVFQIGWLFNNNVLESDFNLGLSITNTTLLINNVDTFHKGAYQCWAINKIGKGESELVNLKVKYAPYCKANQRVYYGISKNEKAQIVCQVESDPMDVIFHWSFQSNSSGLTLNQKENLIEQIHHVSFQSESTKSVATFIPKSSLDYGVLYCWAENLVGLQKDPCTFFIIPSDIPGPPKNCAITNTTAHTLTVECTPGYNGGSNQVFHLEVYIDSSPEKRFVNNLTSSEYPFFIANSLPSGNTFYLVTYASNLSGKSSSVVITGNTLIAERWTTDYFEKNIINEPIVILMTIIGILVILAIVIITIIKIKSKKECGKDKTINFKSNLASPKPRSRKRDNENCIHTPLNQISDVACCTSILHPDMIIENKINSIELEKASLYGRRLQMPIIISPHGSFYQNNSIEHLEKLCSGMEDEEVNEEEFNVDIKRNNDCENSSSF